MRSLFSIRSLLWPSLAAMAFAAFFVVTQPGTLYADAAEYDAIAHTILHGRFELAETTAPNLPLPTMHREPGYPIFRAAVYVVAGDHPKVILWIQALLAGLTVALAGMTIRRLDPRWALPTSWLLALYPGFSVWACQHYSEMLAAFLATLVAYTWVRAWEVREKTASAWWWALSFGCAAGVLALTKASFELLPVFAAGFLLFTGSWQRRWKPALIALAAFGIVIAPWIVRNAVTFGEATITYRTGIVLYTRSLNAKASWAQLATSYGSALVGQATMLRFFPNTPPIVIQLWQTTWDDKNALLDEGLRYYQADNILLGRAVKTIFSSPSVFARYVLWSPINDLRLFELTSPLSPKFGVENIYNQEAREGHLSHVQLFTVLFAHGLQFMWWALIAYGFFLLVRSRSWGHPALLFVGYAAVLYAPLDDIPRYAVPMLPWIVALIVAALIHPVERSAHRVLVLTDSSDTKNGWGAYAVGLVAALRASGKQVTLLTSDDASEGPRLPGVHASRVAWLWASIWMWAWLRLNPHELIHVAAEPYARLYRLFGRIPFLLTVHGTYVDPNAHGPRWAADAFRASLTHAARIVAVSVFTRAHVPDAFQSKTVVIPNGVDVSIADELFDAAPAHGSPLILSVGAIKPRKGFDRLISGFACFAQTHPSAELVIIGRADRPDVRDALIRQAEALKIADRIRFLGEVTRPELLGWYRACDVFALTPVEDGGFEGFGLVYLEANAFGKPCVSSRGSAGEEVIQEGESGYPARATDPEEIASSLDRALLLDSERIRHSLAQRTWTVRAKEYVLIYGQILKG